MKQITLNSNPVEIMKGTHHLNHHYFNFFGLNSIGSGSHIFGFPKYIELVIYALTHSQSKNNEDCKNFTKFQQQLDHF